MRLKRIVTFLLILCFALSIVPLYATPDEDDLKAKQKKNQKTQQQLQSTISQKNKELRKISNQLESLDKNLYSTIASLKKVESDLEKLDNKIAVTKRELERASENAVAQKEMLKKRVRVMYENGNVGYLSVLLDSTDFFDFVSRMDFLKQIIDFDVKLFAEISEYKMTIEQTKAQLQEEQDEKEVLKQQIADKKKEIERLMEDKKQAVDDINEDLDKLEERLDQLVKESAELAKLIAAAQSKKKYTGGEMEWPAPDHYKITSPYGYRVHPILKKKKMHTGIDISIPSGKKIVAANDGDVIYADYYGGYGYAVIIDHGGKISTLYAHNSKLLVSKGQSVKKGEKIAESGSTGMSTGPHLHFEVREDGQHTDPMKYFK
ncbi:MAG: murein hydrolase activator EnvC family protein [Bacillota bacterium]